MNLNKDGLVNKKKLAKTLTKIIKPKLVNKPRISPNLHRAMKPLKADKSLDSQQNVTSKMNPSIANMMDTEAAEQTYETEAILRSQIESLHQTIIKLTKELEAARKPEYSTQERFSKPNSGIPTNNRFEILANTDSSTNNEPTDLHLQGHSGYNAYLKRQKPPDATSTKKRKNEKMTSHQLHSSTAKEENPSHSTRAKDSDTTAKEPKPPPINVLNCAAKMVIDLLKSPGNNLDFHIKKLTLQNSSSTLHLL